MCHWDGRLLRGAIGQRSTSLRAEQGSRFTLKLCFSSIASPAITCSSRPILKRHTTSAPPLPGCFLLVLRLRNPALRCPCWLTVHDEHCLPQTARTAQLNFAVRFLCAHVYSSPPAAALYISTSTNNVPLAHKGLAMHRQYRNMAQPNVEKETQ